MELDYIRLSPAHAGTLSLLGNVVAWEGGRGWEPHNRLARQARRGVGTTRFAYTGRMGVKLIKRPVTRLKKPGRAVQRDSPAPAAPRPRALTDRPTYAMLALRERRDGGGVDSGEGLLLYGP